MPTPQDVLGVSPAASAADVRGAYLRLAKRWHPDAPGGDAKRFRAIRSAYEELTTPAARMAAPTVRRQVLAAPSAPIALNTALAALLLALGIWCWFAGGKPQDGAVSVFSGWALILMAWRTFARRRQPLRNPLVSLAEGVGIVTMGAIGFILQIVSVGILLFGLLGLMALLEHAGIVH